MRTASMNTTTATSSVQTTITNNNNNRFIRSRSSPSLSNLSTLLEFAYVDAELENFHPTSIPCRTNTITNTAATATIGNTVQKKSQRRNHHRPTSNSATGTTGTGTTGTHSLSSSLSMTTLSSSSSLSSPSLSKREETSTSSSSSSVIFNLKILLLCVIVSYLNEAIMQQQQPQQQPSLENNDHGLSSSTLGWFDIDTGMKLDTRLQDEFNTHAATTTTTTKTNTPTDTNNEDELFKSNEHNLNNQTGQSNTHHSSSSLHLQTKNNAIMQHPSTNNTTIKNHSIFYPYTFLDTSIVSPSSSTTTTESTSTLLLPLQHQFQSFYNNSIHQLSSLHDQDELHHTIMINSLPLHYDIAESTEYNYKSILSSNNASNSFSNTNSTTTTTESSHTLFYGRYVDIRKSLDYTYHSNYIPSRQLVQDEIIQYILAKSQCCQLPSTSTSSTKSSISPWIVFTAGAMGAGKSYTIKHLHSKHYFPLSNFITIDPDEIRNLLPEYQYYINIHKDSGTHEQNSDTGAGDSSSSSTTTTTSKSSMMEYAGSLTRKESGYICEILVQIALRNGCNVLMDGSLRDYKWYKKHFHSLRTQFQQSNGIKIGIIHVQAPKEAIYQRAEQRSKITKRIVPRHVLEESIELVPKSVKILSKYVDFFVELYNGRNTEEIEIVTEGMTWDSFQNAFYQETMQSKERKIPNQKNQAIAITKSKNEKLATSTTTITTTSTSTTHNTKQKKDGRQSTATKTQHKSSFFQGGMKVDEEMDYQLLRLLSKL